MVACSVRQQSIRVFSRGLAKVPMALPVWIHVGCASHRVTALES